MAKSMQGIRALELAHFRFVIASGARVAIQVGLEWDRIEELKAKGAIA